MRDCKGQLCALRSLSLGFTFVRDSSRDFAFQGTRVSTGRQLSEIPHTSHSPDAIRGIAALVFHWPGTRQTNRRVLQIRCDKVSHRNWTTFFYCSHWHRFPRSSGVSSFHWEYFSIVVEILCPSKYFFVSMFGNWLRDVLEIEYDFYDSSLYVMYWITIYFFVPTNEFNCYVECFGIEYLDFKVVSSFSFLFVFY